MVIHGSRLVFHGSRSVLWFFKVLGWFFMVELGFHGYSWFQVSFP